MKNKVNYKIKFYINMLLIVLEVSFFLIIIIRNIYNNKPLINRCVTKFNCTACNGGTQECKTMTDVLGETMDITCPCDDYSNEMEK